MLGRMNTQWPYLDDWIDIYGTDHAAGKSARDFEAACKRVLADERYAKIIEPDYMTTDGGGESQGDSKVPDGSDTTVKSKRRRTNTVVDTDSTFLESLKGIMNGCKEAASTVGGGSGSSNDPNAERRLKLNEELRKFPALQPRYRILIGTELIVDPVKLEYFFGLPDDDRAEFIDIQVHNLILKGGR